MARNQEKAQSMLFRFREAQAAELGVVNIHTMRRPKLASTVQKMQEAERWRYQVITEISRKISQIQNAGMAEHMVRDLNDEINKLMREKRAWEYRIKELGGPDYIRSAPRMIDAAGKEIPGQRGYKYFGRAKDLPGVRELLEQQQPPEMEEERKEPAKASELYKRCDAFYYGYRDEEDGMLLAYEQEQERIAEDKFRVSAATSVDEVQREKKVLVEKSTAVMEVPTLAQVNKHTHMQVPTQKEVEEYLLDRRKQELLEKYVSEELIKEVEETKELTGRKA